MFKLIFQKIFAISSTALFASVSIFDHILSLTTVPTNMYMLIAIVSLQIATKVDGSSHIRVHNNYIVFAAVFLTL